MGSYTERPYHYQKTETIQSLLKSVIEIKRSYPDKQLSWQRLLRIIIRFHF